MLAELDSKANSKKKKRLDKYIVRSPHLSAAPLYSAFV